MLCNFSGLLLYLRGILVGSVGRETQHDTTRHDFFFALFVSRFFCCSLFFVLE